MGVRLVKREGINGITTSPVDLGEAVLEECGLDQRGEPLRLVPVSQLVASDLTEAHDDGVHVRLRGNIFQDVFGHPLGLPVTSPERHRRVIERYLRCGTGAVVVCVWR